jgi:hypothetical protein
MPNVISKSMADKYLLELWADEQKIETAGEAFERAKALLEVTLRRYTALRDFITEQLGQSPYTDGVAWPDRDEDGGYFTRPQGKFRFTAMKVGEAVEQAIRERRGIGLTLDDLVEALSEGGLGFPDPVQARAVNAALLKLPLGIKRGRFTGGPKYGATCYWAEDDEPEEVEIDDLPFE